MRSPWTLELRRKTEKEKKFKAGRRWGREIRGTGVWAFYLLTFLGASHENIPQLPLHRGPWQLAPFKLAHEHSWCQWESTGTRPPLKR